MNYSARHSIRSGNWELAAVHVVTPGNTSIWVHPEQGLNLVYGRNGVGKSFLIDGMKHLLALGSTEHPRNKFSDTQPLVRGFVRLEHDLLMEELFCAAVKDLANRRAWSNRKEWEAAREVSNWQSTPTSSKEIVLSGALGSPLDWQLFADGLRRKVNEVVQTLLEHLDDDASDPAEAGNPDAHSGRSPYEVVAPLLHNLRWLESLTKGLSETLSARFKYWRDLNADEILADLERFGFNPKHLDSDVVIDPSFENLSFSQLLEIHAWDLLTDLERVLNTPAGDVEWSLWVPVDDLPRETTAPARDFVAEPDRLIQTVAQALRIATENPTLWIERREDLSWNVGLAVRYSDFEVEDGPVNRLRRLLTTRDITDEGTLRAIAVLGESRVAWIVDHTLSVDRETAFNSPETPTGYLPLAPYRPLCATEVPLFWAVDLDRPVDMLEVAKDLLTFAVGYSRFGADRNGDATVMLSRFRDQSVLELPRLAKIEGLLGEINQLLRRLDLDVAGVRFSVSTDLGEWSRGEAASLTFQTAHSDKWLPFSLLSSAQQAWVSIVMAIVAARPFVAPILLADEPDSGIHERAAHSVFQFLTGSGFDGFVSSHSVSALRQAMGHLLHLYVDSTGVARLERPGLGSDVEAAAKRLGTTPFDLLSLKRAIILVEGSHDAEVVRRLVSLSQDPLLPERLLVAPMRGVKNVVSAADSVILTEFTDLHVIVVVDNASASALSTAMSAMVASLSQGMSIDKAFHQSGLARLGDRGTFEERVLTDLLHRTAQRGLLHRFHVCPLPTADIIELLPEDAFGLTASWSDLRADFRHESSGAPQREDFKDWLRRTRSAQISTAKIGRAFERLDYVPEPLAVLLHEIEIAAALPVLDR